MMLSRRRKLGESPGAKGAPAPPPPPTPPIPLAGDEERPPSSGGRLRGRRRALREVTQASESCPSVSKRAEEMGLYKTPKRLLQTSFRSPIFSSPCDTDGPQEIFWDPNSPTTCQLDERRNKKHDRRCSVEISDIVNRIAPQGEKPTTDSLLNMWIGEGAIPCTPGITKIKSRTKTSYTKFKAQSSEEELIKLAKEFDKNMVELDVMQEQVSETHDFVQTISEAETSNNYKDETQIQDLQSVSDEVPEADIAVTVTGNSSISTEEHYKNNSVFNFDPNAEAALTALFDGSTQKCSGQFSQGLPHASFTTSPNIHGKNNTLKEKVNSTEAKVSEKYKIPSQQNVDPVSVTSIEDSLVMAKSNMTSSISKSEVFNKPGDIHASIDFDDDDEWEHMITEDSFVMQISQAPELLTTTEISQPAVQKDICMVTAIKNDKAKVGINEDLAIGKSLPKNLQDLSSETNNKDIPNPTRALFLPKPNNEPIQLAPTGNKVKFERNSNKLSFPNKISGYSELSCASTIQNTKEIADPKLGPNMKVSAKESNLVRRHTNYQLQTGEVGEKPPNCHQSFNVPVKTNSNNSIGKSNETSLCNVHQKDPPKQCSVFDDWNDPKLATEIMEACHELENSWDADDDDDDDLLYQACDHVEKLTQQQDLKKDSFGSEHTQKVNYNSYLGMETNLVTAGKGYQLPQYKCLNTDNISTHGTSLREVIQTNKLQCKEGTNYGNFTYPTGIKNPNEEYKYPNYQNNNKHVSWNSTSVPIGMNKSSIPTGNLTLGISIGQTCTDIPSFSRNLHNQTLSHSVVATQNPCHVDKTAIATSSDYSFTKIKNPPILPYFSHISGASGSIPDTKILQHSDKSKIQLVSSLPGETAPQQLLKRQFSESCKRPTKEEEEKNRKYSPEEIQKKRQEALVRRMSKARTSFMSATHI